MSLDIRSITDLVREESRFVESLTSEVGKVVVGQKYMVERILVGLLTGGHILLEGVPGLAKTLTCNTLAACIGLDFQRIQFTPDLLPADITGTQVYNQKTGDFDVKRGPIFTNLVLADEVNRAPAKVQSALLEAMQELQVTLGDETFELAPPFLVLATQNPIEQEGTYPLPEAQVDRFMLKVQVGYPDRAEERVIIDRMTGVEVPVASQVVDVAQIRSAQDVVSQVYIDDKIKDYIIDIVFATREPATYGLKRLEDYIEYGASPRASIYLAQAARAHAFLRHRGFVTPEDVKAISADVLRHRIIPTFEAEAEEWTSEMLLKEVLAEVEVPVIPKELIKKVRKLEIVTRRRVNDQLAGAYHSVFKGRGMDFDEVRHYQAGDDPRTIDWNVSARMNGMFVKRYKEERELTVILLVDASASLGFGSVGQRKRMVAAELAAVLAISAITNNDRVGLIIFTDQIELFVPPKRGRKHVLRVIVEILNYQGRAEGTDIKAALDYVAKVTKRRAVVFLISDFLDKGFEHSLNVTAKRHDLVPIVLTDPMEAEVPNLGLAYLQDPETGALRLIDTGSKRVRRWYRETAEAQAKHRDRTFRKLKMDVVNVRTNESYIEPLASFFRKRAHRY